MTDARFKENMQETTMKNITSNMLTRVNLESSLTAEEVCHTQPFSSIYESSQFLCLTLVVFFPPFKMNWILFCATLWCLRPTLANMRSDISQSKDTRFSLTAAAETHIYLKDSSKSLFSSAGWFCSRLWLSLSYWAVPGFWVSTRQTFSFRSYL